MPVESYQELAQKIAKQEALLAYLEDAAARGERLNQQDIANTQMEIARLKNLKGDEGVNPASDIQIPQETIDQTTPVNTPDHKNVKKQILSGNKDITDTVSGNNNFNPTE